MSQTPDPFPHWMLREIHEQPATLQATLDRYVADGKFREDTCGPLREWLREAHEIVICASGSSRHAGLVAEILIEDAGGSMWMWSMRASIRTGRSAR